MGAIAPLSFSVGDGNDDSAMEFIGTLSEINAALASLTFEGLAPDTLSIQVNDLDNGGSGQPLTADSSINILTSQQNLAPILMAIGDKQVQPEEELLFTVSAVDNNVGDTLSFQLESGAPEGATFDPQTQEFRWIPTVFESGEEYLVTITVTDDAATPLSDSETFRITVGDPQPEVLDILIKGSDWSGEFLGAIDSVGQGNLTISSLGYSLATPSEPLPWANTNTLSIQFSDPMNLSSTDLFLSGLDDQNVPAITNFSYDPIQGVAVWQFADAFDDGNYEIAVASSAVDESGQSVLPQWLGASSPDGTFRARFSILVGDVNGDGLVSEQDQQLIASAAGTLPGDPNYLVFGDLDGSGTAGAHDSSALLPLLGGSLDTISPQLQRGLPLSYGIPNLPPEIESIADKTVAQEDTLKFELNATDPEGEALEFNIVSSNTFGAEILSGNQFKWTPDEDVELGPYLFVLEAKDIWGNVSETAFVIDVTETADEDQNHAPNITLSVDNFNAVPDQELKFVITANDPDPEDTPEGTITWGVDGAPSGASFDKETGEFTWTPTKPDGGKIHTFIAWVEDDGDPKLRAERKIAIDVELIDESPEFDPVDDKTVKEGKEFTITVAATDEETATENLVYRATKLPEGADFEEGKITWTPSEKQGPGEYLVSVQVEDEAGNNENVSFTVTVEEENDPPELEPASSHTFEEWRLARFWVFGSDPDLPRNNLIFSFEEPFAHPDEQGNATITGDGLFEWYIPLEAELDSYTFPVTVADRTEDDPEVKSATVNITVDVEERNTTPEIIIERVEGGENYIALNTASTGATFVTTAKAGEVSDNQIEFELKILDSDEPNQSLELVEIESTNLLSLNGNIVEGTIEGTITAPEIHGITLGVKENGVLNEQSIITFEVAILVEDKLGPIVVQEDDFGLELVTGSQTFNVTNNDLGFEPDYYQVNFEVSKLEHGEVSPNNDGTFTYTPSGTSAGVDRFTYTILSNGLVSTTVGLYFPDRFW